MGRNHTSSTSAMGAAAPGCHLRDLCGRNHELHRGGSCVGDSHAGSSASSMTSASEGSVAPEGMRTNWPFTRGRPGRAACGSRTESSS